MKNEQDVTEDLALAWWDEEWALKDKKRINQKKPLPADDTIGWINKILEKGVETRLWHLRTDVIMRVLSLIVRDKSYENLMLLGKRIGIIRHELGDAQGGQIIQEAIYEAELELAKYGMTNDDIKMKLEMLIKQTGGTPVF